MSGDIVDRLRDFHRRYKSDGNITMLRATGLAQEAADEIEALRADWPLYEFLRTQAAQLQRWNDEALTVFAQWDEVAAMVPHRLGAMLSEGVRDEIIRLRAEAEATMRTAEWVNRSLQAERRLADVLGTVLAKHGAIGRMDADRRRALELWRKARGLSADNGEDDNEHGEADEHPDE